MEVTAEIRAAVLAEECDRLGHMIDLYEAVNDDPDRNGEHVIQVRARNADTIPHLRCRRCSWVWLIVTDGPSYDDAEAALNDQTVPERRRPPRAQRRAKRLAREEAARVAAAAQAVELPGVDPVTPSAPMAVAHPIP